jgi:hypothetical protein
MGESWVSEYEGKTVKLPLVPQWWCQEHAPEGAEPGENKDRYYCVHRPNPSERESKDNPHCKDYGKWVVWVECGACRGYIERFGLNGHWPRHEASGGCGSGGRAHCTCDTCF